MRQDNSWRVAGIAVFVFLATLSLGALISAFRAERRSGYADGFAVGYAKATAELKMTINGGTRYLTREVPYGLEVTPTRVSLVKLYYPNGVEQLAEVSALR